MITLDDQIAEVDRELRQRDWVYPKLIASGKLTTSAAERQLARMRAVRDSLVEAKKAAGNPQGRLFG